MLTFLLVTAYDSSVKEETRYWLSRAEYDLMAAEKQLSVDLYAYAVFFCHSAVEKLLKGLLVELAGVDTPPYTHNLLVLATMIGLDVPSGHMEFLARLSPQATATRYAEDLGVYTHQVAEDYLQQTKEIFLWLRQKLP